MRIWRVIALIAAAKMCGACIVLFFRNLCEFPCTHWFDNFCHASMLFGLACFAMLFGGIVWVCVNDLYFPQRKEVQ